MTIPAIRESGVATAGATATFTTAATTAVGDYIVAIQANETSTSSNLNTSPTGTAGAWTTITSNTTRTQTRIRAWYRPVTVAGAQIVTVSATGGTSNVARLIVFVMQAGTFNPNSFIDGVAVNSQGTTSPQTLASITTATYPESLLIGAWHNATYGSTAHNGTAPTGMTRQQQSASTSTGLMACTQTLSSAGATGTRAATWNTTSATAGWSGLMFAITGTPLVKSGTVTSTLGVVAGSAVVGAKATTAATTSTLGTLPASSGVHTSSGSGTSLMGLLSSGEYVHGVRQSITTTLGLGSVGARIFIVHSTLGLASTVIGAKGAAGATLTELGEATTAAGRHQGLGAVTSDLRMRNVSLTGAFHAFGEARSRLALSSTNTVIITGGEPPSPIGHDLQTAVYVPPLNKPLRFIVQDIRSGEIRDWDLPLSDVQITYTLSGPSVLRATLGPEYRDLRDVNLDAWASWIHVEEDGIIRASVIVQPSSISGESLEIEGIGVAGYPAGMPFMGDLSLIETDTAQIMRMIWVHLLSYPDCALGVTLDPTATGTKLGIPAYIAKVVDENGNQVYDEVTETNSQTGAVTVKSRTPATKAIEAQPYELSWFDNTDCGSEIDNLARSTPFDYAERVSWHSSRTSVNHHIQIGYPRLGTKRIDLRFAEDENLIQAVVARETSAHYASQVVVIGKGEGRAAVRGLAGTAGIRRIRRVVTVTDKTLANQVVATSLANEELRRRMSATEFSDIIVDATHDNAPLGSWALGDDILVQCNVPYMGEVALWHRIIAYTWTPESDLCTLSLKRSEQFAYGELGAALGGSRGSAPNDGTVVGTGTSSNAGGGTGNSGDPAPVIITKPGTDDPVGGGGTTTTIPQTLGVGGIATAKGSKVTLISANSTSTLKISSPGTWDGQGHTVQKIEIAASNVTVQNFYVRGATNAGIYSQGTNNTIQNCDIAGVKVGSDDINGISFFGDYHRILFCKMDSLVAGDPQGSHTDGVQTWATPSKNSSSHVVIWGNDIRGPVKSDPKYIHQGVMAEGPKSDDGGGGGSGKSTDWLVGANYFKTYGNQAVKFDDIHGVKLTKNTFAGSATKVVEMGGLSTGGVYYSDNIVSGSYGSVGIGVTNGAGPTFSQTVTTGGTSSGGSSGGAAPVITTPGGGGSSSGSTFTSPGSCLKIGSSNHFNVGIGARGGAHTDYSESQIKGGFVKGSYFELNSAKTAVRFTAYMDGGRTSKNTKYSRSELRELKSDGTSKASWDASSGIHRMTAKIKILHVAPKKPQFCVAQIHDAEDDTLQVLYDGGKIVLKVGGTAAGTLASSYSMGTEFDIDILVQNKQVKVTYNGGSPITKAFTGGGQYFKIGAYAQSNTTYDDADEYMSMELRNLSVSHS